MPEQLEHLQTNTTFTQENSHLSSTVDVRQDTNPNIITFVPGTGNEIEQVVDTGHQALLEALDAKIEILGSEEQRLAAVQQLGSEDFTRLITEIHSYVAPNTDREPVNRTMRVANVVKRQQVTGQLFVDPADRQEFSIYVTEKLQNAASVQEAADIIGFGAVQLHMFEDGNGRTARVLHTLIRDGYDGSDTAKQRLQNAGTGRDRNGAQIRLSFGLSQGLQAQLRSELGVDPEAISRIKKLLDEATATADETSGLSYRLPSVMAAQLRNIEDESIKLQLSKVLEQRDFGPFVMNRIVSGNSHSEDFTTVGTLMRLAAIDDEAAMELIDYDRKTRLNYMKRVIDIAAGEEVESKGGLYHTAMGRDHLIVPIAEAA